MTVIPELVSDLRLVSLYRTTYTLMRRLAVNTGHRLRHNLRLYTRVYILAFTENPLRTAFHTKT